MSKKTFRDLGLDEPLAAALDADGIVEPFPIQELTLPVALERHDVIGQARTGSGKTLGFGLPLLSNLDLARREVQALVVTPTRELCVQVTEDLESAGRNLDVHILSIYGGVPIEPQTKALHDGVHVVVGTPGRLLDHVRRGNLDLSTARTLVLDEADEMLDMGFLPDVEQLIDRCADERHTMLFSATMPSAVVNLARRYMDRPTFIRAEVEEHTIPDRIEQHFFLTHKMDKPRVLARILQSPERGLAVVFTRTKAMADRLVEDLRNYDVDAIAIHGDLRQATREKNLDKFKSEEHRHDVLVATEVAARGLDIDDLTHVINYDCPEDEKMYLHRVGRTARAGESGVAISFATFAEVARLNAIRKALDLGDEPLQEVFSTSDELTELFGLPDRTPWAHLGRSGSNEKGSTSSRSKAKNAKPSRSNAKSAKNPKASRSNEERAEPSRSSDERSKRSRSRSSDRSSRTSSSGDRSGEDDAVRVRTRTRTRPTTEEPARSGSSSGTSSSGGRNRKRARPAAAHAGGNRGKGGEGRSGSSEDRGRSSRSGNGAGSDAGGRQRLAADPASVPTDPGRDARGDGQPMLVRRVKVDHLP